MFWNMCKNPNEGVLVDIYKKYGFMFDVFGIAESVSNKSIILRALNSSPRGDGRKFWHVATNDRMTSLYTSVPIEFIDNIVVSQYFVACTIVGLFSVDVNIVVCHAPSKLHYDESNQRREIFKMFENICEYEEHVDCDSSIVFGDFNVSPTDISLISFDGANSFLHYGLATKRYYRKFKNETKRTFYNPMLHLFRDHKIISGTYYWSGSDVNSMFWYMFDQVLIRSPLADRFEHSSLEVVTSGHSVRMLTPSGSPDKKKSDHLPFKFSFNLEESFQ